MGYAFFFFSGSVKNFPNPLPPPKSIHTHYTYTFRYNEIIHHFTAFAATIATVAGYETTGSKQTVDILIDYIIKETPELSQNDVANWENGDTVTLQYVVNNNEESEITVVGVTGQFKNPINNEIVTNLTTGKVGPIAVPPGEAIKFDQKLMLI